TSTFVASSRGASPFADIALLTAWTGAAEHDDRAEGRDERDRDERCPVEVLADDTDTAREVDRGRVPRVVHDVELPADVEVRLEPLRLQLRRPVAPVDERHIARLAVVVDDIRGDPYAVVPEQLGVVQGIANGEDGQRHRDGGENDAPQPVA